MKHRFKLPPKSRSVSLVVAALFSLAAKNSMATTISSTTT